MLNSPISRNSMTPGTPKPKFQPSSRIAAAAASVTTSNIPGHTELDLTLTLELQELSGLRLPPGEHALQLQIRATLFDLERGCFLGDTFISKPKSVAHMSKRRKSKDAKRDDSDSDADDTSSSSSASLAEGKIAMNLEMILHLHTPATSPSIITVIEFVYVRGSARREGKKALSSAVASESLRSSGWTFLSLFNPLKNGINLEKLFSDADDLSEDSQDADLVVPVPIYLGTPRILPFIYNLLQGTNQAGFLSLKSVPGGILNYRIRYDPTLRNVMTFWPKDTWVERGGVIPGLDTQSMLPSQPLIMNRIQDIRLSYLPNWLQFEKDLVQVICNNYDAEFPGTLDLTETALIVERRIILGYHNGKTFIADPIIANLSIVNEASSPVSSPITDAISGCMFHGQIDLAHPHDSTLNLVIGVEYKLILAIHDRVREKSFFQKLMKNFRMVTDESTGKITGVERVVCVGWCQWNPSDDSGLGTDLTLRDEPCPFLETLVYSHPEPVNAKKKELISLHFVYNSNDGLLDEKARLANMATSAPHLDLPPLPKERKRSKHVDASTAVEDMQPMSELVENHNSAVQPFAMPAVSKSRATLSKLEKARLLNAGFTLVTDELGFTPTNTGVEKNAYQFELEKRDPRTNELSAQFQAITFFANNSSTLPANDVYFSFQFYLFPECVTEVCKIYNGPIPIPKINAMENESFETPGILYKYDEDGRVLFQEPGISLQYKVESLDILSFVKYMHTELFIDVWDGTSHLHIGQAVLDLKAGLRGGKSSAYFDAELDIFPTLKSDAKKSGISRSPSRSSLHGYKMLEHNERANTQAPSLGKLCIRFYNLGRSKCMPPVREITIKDPIVLPDPVPVCFPNYYETLNSGTEVFRESRILVDSDPDFKATMLQTWDERESIKNTKAATTHADLRKEEDRKLSSIAKMKLKIGELSGGNKGESPIHPGHYAASRSERARDLQTMDIFRERKKNAAVVHALTQSITTTHTIYPSFGSAEFIEFNIKNPYAVDSVFTITFSDPELRIVERQKEWAYLRRLHGLPNNIPRDTDQSLKLGADGQGQIYLNSKEVGSIPLIFQSFLTGQVDSGSDMYSQEKQSIQARSILMTILNNKNIPVSILELVIQPKNYYITRVMRLFAPERELVKKSLMFLPRAIPNLSGEQQTHMFDPSKPDSRYIRCSVADVISNLVDYPGSSAKEISFKIRAENASEARTVYFAFYHDPFQVSISEIWRVNVYSLHRMDANCIAGQSNDSSVILKGSSFTRNVKFFANVDLDYMSIVSPTPFALTANTLNEVALRVRPWDTMTRECILNVVDADSRNLVTSWIIICHCTAPTITKSFDLSISKGTTVNKRISYTNPYNTKRQFRLTTNRPDVVQFKESLIRLQPCASTFIGLKFAPSKGPLSGWLSGVKMATMPSAVEALIFLTDESDKIEECLAIAISYL